MASRTRRSSPDAIVQFLAGPGAAALEQFLARQRWFAAKARGIRTVEVEDWAALDPRHPLLLVLLRVDGERYYVPLAGAGAEADLEGAVARFGSKTVVDAHADPTFGRQLVAAIAAGRALTGGAGRFLFRSTESAAFPPGGERASLAVRRLSGEQSNTSIVLGSALILKSLRRPPSGISPDLEVLRFLTDRTGFRHISRLAGWIEYVDGGGRVATLGVVQGFIENAGDGWRHTLAQLRRLRDSLDELDAGAGAAAQRPAALARSLADEMRDLGAVTGGLHVALASDRSVPAFRPEPVTREDVRRWAASMGRDFAQLTVDAAETASRTDTASATTPEMLKRAGGRLDETLAGLDLLVATGTHKIRCHGDYHLGQVLKTRDSFAVIDFEGEPARPVEERRAKQSGLKDVAGMLRSFDYAVHAAVADLPEAGRARALPWLERWEQLARAAFLDGYRTAVAASPVCLVPASGDDLLRACAVFELEKACYELGYELNNRRDWVPIAAAGIARILRALSSPTTIRPGSDAGSSPR